VLGISAVLTNDEYEVTAALRLLKREKRTTPQRDIRDFSLLKSLEHRMGFEPMNTGFADQRVSHFAIGALG
jgi:hypothetical protein